jgi:hypothetical protein
LNRHVNTSLVFMRLGSSGVSSAGRANLCFSSLRRSRESAQRLSGVNLCL